MWELADRAWPELLERVCAEGLIDPVFQPIVDVAGGVVCGYEGLARFACPESLAGPHEFFAAAAWHGYTARLEAAAIEAVLDCREALPPNCFLSFNLSPSALLAPEVDEVLAAQPNLSTLIVEITEQTPVEDYEALSVVLERLRSRGAMVAVDDTGAGYASLSHLIALQPQFVKLDRALVEGVDRDRHRAAAVAAIGALAGELDAWLVAEGVERVAELERLIDLDVPLAQGYLLGRPDPEMRALDHRAAARLRSRRVLGRGDRLSALARPAPVVYELPELVAEATVLVDSRSRPRDILVPAGGRRLSRHKPMCVQRGDEVRDVALRAAARRTEDRYGPLCLCDEHGALIGIITIEVLLETLARESRSSIRTVGQGR